MGLTFGFGTSRLTRDFTPVSQLSMVSTISIEEAAGVFFSFLADCWARNMLIKSRADERFSTYFLASDECNSSWTTLLEEILGGDITEILDNMRVGTFETELCKELSTLLKEFDESWPSDCFPRILNFFYGVRGEKLIWLCRRPISCSGNF